MYIEWKRFQRGTFLSPHHDNNTRTKMPDAETQADLSCHECAAVTSRLQAEFEEMSCKCVKIQKLLAEFENIASTVATKRMVALVAGTKCGSVSADDYTKAVCSELLNMCGLNNKRKRDDDDDESDDDESDDA